MHHSDMLISAIAAATLLGAQSTVVNEPHKNTVLIAQATYEGYLTCDQFRSRNCDIELNRRKGSIKDLCYSVWTGNWPERRTLDPATIKLYIDWCNQAREDISFASREFPPLIAYVGKYRRFNPEKSDPEQVINAALNTQYFLNKCASKSASKASLAMELWGTTQHGNWVIPELEVHSPTRYPEINMACDRKSWARKLLTDTQPIIEASWTKQVASAEATSCKLPVKGAVPDLADVEALKASMKLLNGFTMQAPLLAKMEPRPIPESDDQLSLLINTAKERSQTCQLAIQQSESMIQVAEEEKERQRQLQAAREAEAARKAAAARAEQQRRAAAARAAEAAAAAERARKQAEVQRLKDNLDLE